MTAASDAPKISPRGDTSQALSSRLTLSLTLSLFAIGFVTRVAPLGNAGDRLLFQWPTEDGYLTLQIARNMALGLGMSVSEGTIPTNGTQPLCTFLWSLLFRAVDADKTTGVLLVQVLETAIAMTTAWLLFLVARRFWQRSFDGRSMAMLAAAAWFASPAIVPHTMNCLESGGYALVTLLTVHVIQSAEPPPGRWSIQRCLYLGLLLGVVFWTRNDGVFLILGVCLAHWLVGVRREGLPLFGRSLRETLVFGATSVFLALPWLVSNYLDFGHLMPISGIAESRGASFAHNLHLVPPMLVEYLLVFVPIPQSLVDHAGVAAVTSIVLSGCVFMAFRWVKKRGKDIAPEEITVLVFGTCLALFYGLYFGASHFMSRYMFPLSPFLVMAWVAFFFAVSRRLTEMGHAYVSVIGHGVVLLLSVGLQIREYRQGPAHEHRQVIEWVEANVTDDVWVGGIQTGTLGFFHDKTYNLDGKVSPEALSAKLVSSIPEYVVDKNISYLVDWSGIAGWIHLHPIDKHFEVLLLDKKKNLAVLRRVN